MTDLFGNKIVYASENEPINNIIERAGIETIREANQVFWLYNGKKVVRTNQPDWIGFIERQFQIKIIIT